MSKDNGTLRLLGSPVNLSYRSKKKEGKTIRNRPRSALLNSVFTPDSQENFKRPFSADAKERAPSTRSLLNTFTADLLHSYNSSPNVQIVAPTTDILGNSKTTKNQTSIKRDKDLCSNASDYGSEDTYISLGTKIKNKAQVTHKNRNVNTKNLLKYKTVRKNRKVMDETEDKSNETYGFDIKITERTQTVLSPPRDCIRSLRTSSPVNVDNIRSLSPSFKTRAYESYFIPLDSQKNINANALAGRVSFGINNAQADVEHSIDTYSRRLNLTKKQLSLVEEESTQDLDSVPSQNLSDISQENSIEDPKDSNSEIRNCITEQNNYVVEVKDDQCPKMTQNYINEVRTYSSFYDDFANSNTLGYKRKLSSSVGTVASSKDSGYIESGITEDRNYKTDYSLPTTSLLKKSNSLDKFEEQPKSLDSASTNSNEKVYKTFPLEKKWVEPLNHSRLLYKDFFLKKEGHVALPPQNSPSKNKTNDILEPSNDSDTKTNNENLDYPQYLLNSSTKAYTSKVIEDYKKELEAINNLHELTIKDIQTDSISPTPFNIDQLFEQHTDQMSEKVNTNEESQSSSHSSDVVRSIKPLTQNKPDVSKISTKELIQNYFKVKEGDNNKVAPRNMKKFEKKVNHFSSTEETKPKPNWNNKIKPNCEKPNSLNTIKNQTHKNMFTLKTPLSARIESVQNDKDIDSWMSLSVPTPPAPVGQDDIAEEIKILDTPKNKIETTNTYVTSDEKCVTKELTTTKNGEDSSSKSKELNSSSTVLDIYSMLKDIESYGENPVTELHNLEIIPDTAKTANEDVSYSPKDNFMEIFQFLEKVEQSANDALSVVTNAMPPTVPKLEVLLKLPQTELAQRLVTASLQLEERSCCIALLQESLSNHKEQMINKISNLEKQSNRNVSKVKQECEDAIKRHQNFIDQLINDKKTLNHRIEQLVDERRSLEERWKRSAQSLEERYKLELRNQHDKMAAAQQVARQRWVRQKAEKIKELTVKGLEGELREMAERQQKEISDLKMAHAEQTGRAHAKHAQELEELRRRLEDEKEAALVKERHLASSRMEKQILELELTYQEQRTRLVSDMRAENERVAAELADKERTHRLEIEKWREEQERALEEKRLQLEIEVTKEREQIEDQLKQKREELELKFEQYKKDFEAEQQVLFKKKVTEITAQHKQERDREIEKAIDSMDAEAQAGRKELQEAMRRNKEQYEAELKELAETEQSTLRRYQEAQARVRHSEDRCAELEVQLTQLEVRNKILTEKNIQLESQAEVIRAGCEEAWRLKIETLNKDMEEMKKKHEEQMHQLYAKVKVAVARKDSAIQALTRESGKHQEKIALLEQKLQQQRKDFLKQK